MNCFVASRQIFSLLLRCANIKMNFIFIPSSRLFLYYCIFFLTRSPSYWIVEELNSINWQYLSVFFFKRFPLVHSDELKTQVFRVEPSIFLLPKMSLDVWVRRVLCPRRGMEKSLGSSVCWDAAGSCLSEVRTGWVRWRQTLEDGGPCLSHLVLLSAADKQSRSLFSLNWLAPCSWFLLLEVLYNLEVCIKLPFNTHSLAITSHLLPHYKDKCPAPKTSITSYFPHPFTEWMGVSRWFPCNAEPGKSPRSSIQALSLSNFILALILPFVI